MTEDLTLKQHRIYDFILERARAGEAHPTLREIGKRFGVSVGTAQEQVSALAAKGFVERRPGGLARGLTLPAEAVELPIVGRVGAGGGVIAQADIEGHLSFKSFTLGTDYLLRVQGDSMIGDGIMEGDLVQVRRQPTADDGDIVVAIVGEEGVVKRLRRSGRNFQLESSNPKYRPITLDFQVIGLVVGLVRRYGR